MAFRSRLETAQPSLKSEQKGIFTKPACIYKKLELRQTRAKIKNGTQVLNFLSLVKLVVFLIVSNLLTVCKAACPDAATVPNQ